MPPTTEQTGRLGAEASALLAVCRAALATIGLTPDAYLYPGLPPVEVGEPPCDGMLAVYVPNIGRLSINLAGGPLGGETLQTLSRIPRITFTVVYAMCADVWGQEQGTPADPDDLTDLSLVHLTTGWVLMNGIVNAVRRDELFSECKNWSLGDLTPLSVSGQSAGWSCDVTVQMDGYDPWVDLPAGSIEHFAAMIAEQGTTAGTT